MSARLGCHFPAPGLVVSVLCFEAVIRGVFLLQSQKGEGWTSETDPVLF